MAKVDWGQKVRDSVTSAQKEIQNDPRFDRELRRERSTRIGELQALLKKQEEERKELEREAKKKKKEADKKAEEAKKKDLFADLDIEKEKPKKNVIGKAARTTAGAVSNFGAEALDTVLSRFGLGDKNPLSDLLPKPAKKVNQFVDRAVDSASFNLRSEARGEDITTGSKGADIVADILGYALPGSAAVKGIKGIKGINKLAASGKKAAEIGKGKRALELGREGAAAGGAFGLGQAAVREAGANHEDYSLADHAKNIGLEAILGAGLDIGVMGGLSTARKGLDSLGIGGKTANAQSMQGDYSFEPQGQAKQAKPEGVSPEARSYIDDAMTEIDELTRQREDDFVEQRFEEFGLNKIMKDQESVDAQWEAVKQQKEEFQRVKQSLGKIIVPKGNKSDFNIPHAFKISKKGDVSDIYQAADRYNMDVDEFVDYLWMLDRDNKLTLKELNGDRPYVSPEDMDELEAGFRQEFQNSDEFRAVLDTKKQVEDTYMQQAQDVEGVQASDELAATKADGYEEEFTQIKSEENLNDHDFEPVLAEEKAKRTTLNRKASPIYNPIEADPSLKGETFTKADDLFDAHATQRTEAEERLERLKRGKAQWEKASPGETNPSLDGAIKRTKAEVEFEAKTKANAKGEFFTRNGKKPWTERFKKAYNNVTTTVIDRKRLVRRMERKERGLGKEYIYKASTIEEGAAPAAFDYINQKVTPVFENLRKKLGESSSEFDPMKLLEYGAARHMKNLIEKHGRVPGKGLPAEANLDSLNQIISEREGSVYDEALGEIRNTLDEMLTMVEDSGFLSKEQRAKMDEMHPDYFPLFRDLDSEPDKFEQAFKQVLSTNKGAMKGMTEGSDVKVNDLMENLLSHIVGMHQLTARQRTKRELFKAVQEGVSFGKIVQSEKAGTNVIPYKHNGKEVFIDVKEEIYEAMTNPLNETERGLISKSIQTVAGWQRASIVMTPDFMLKDSLRSPTYSYVTSRSGATVVDYAYAAIDTITNGIGRRSKAYQQFIENGGGMTSIYAQDINARKSAYRAVMKGNKKGFKDIKNPLEWISMWRGFLEGVEQVPKLAESRATLRKGNNIRDWKKGFKKIEYTADEQQRMIDSVFNAREIYDNRMAGTWTREVNRYVGFLNSNIRGKDKFLQALRENPIRVTTRAAMVTTPPVFAAHIGYKAWATDEQKRMMDEAPLEMKELYTLIPDPSGEGLIRYPKAFEAHLAVGKPLEELLKASRGETYEHELEDRIWAFLKQNLTHNPTLTPFTPAIEIALNKNNFTDREIISQFDKRPKPEQVDITTSQMAILMSNMLNAMPVLENNVSPLQVDHLISGHFPSASDYGLDIMDMATKENLPNERSLIVNPFKKAFQYNNSYSPTVSEFYDTKEDLDYERSQDEEGFLYDGVRDGLKEKQKELKEFSDLRKEILNDPEYSPAEKQQAVDELDRRRNEITRELSDAGITGTKDRTNMTKLEQALLN